MRYADPKESQNRRPDPLYFFISGPFYTEHSDQVGGCGAGSSCRDYRMKSKVPGIAGYMQVVYDRASGRGYLDMDRFNLYKFPKGSLGHVFLEVLAPKGYGISSKGTDVTQLRRMRSRYFQ